MYRFIFILFSFFLLFFLFLLFLHMFLILVERRMGRKWVFMMLAVSGAILGAWFVLVRGFITLMILRFFLSLGLPAIYQIVIITGERMS